LASDQCRSIRKQVHEYVDGEIGDATVVEEHVTRCEDCKTILVEVRSVKKAVGSKAARQAAPAHLVVRVRQRLDQKEKAKPRFRFREFISLRPVSVLAVIVLLVAWYFGIHSRNEYALAREVTRECFAGHERCENSPKLAEHIFTSDAQVLSASLSKRVGVPVHIPDLTAAGYKLVEGHECFVGERLSGHAYFAGIENEIQLSFFCVPGRSGNGALGDRLQLRLDAYVPPTDCWKTELEKGMNIVIWRRGKDRLCVLLGQVARSELLEILEKHVGRHQED
jgi:anti-sigma factor RsiW